MPVLVDLLFCFIFCSQSSEPAGRLLSKDPGAMQLTYINNILETKVGKCGEPGLVDRVLTLRAGSQGFDSHRGHMSERFFLSSRPGYLHPVCSGLENSGIRVAVGQCL